LLCHPNTAEGYIRYILRAILGSGPKALSGLSSIRGLAGFVKQLDISHGCPRDERTPGVFFFGVFFDRFYGESTGAVADQPSVESATSREPHGYSLSVPLLRQVPGQRASPVRLRSAGILYPNLWSRRTCPGGRQAPSSPLQAGLGVVGAKGEPMAMTPCRPCGLGAPTDRHAYFAADVVDLASLPCSVATASASPRRAAAM
jgi:hypothetical protein